LRVWVQVSRRAYLASDGHLDFLLRTKTVTATAAIATTAVPTNTVNGRFADPEGDELEDPTLTWTAIEWGRVPLLAVTETE